MGLYKIIFDQLAADKFFYICWRKSSIWNGKLYSRTDFNKILQSNQSFTNPRLQLRRLSATKACFSGKQTNLQTLSIGLQTWSSRRRRILLLLHRSGEQLVNIILYNCILYALSLRLSGVELLSWCRIRFKCFRSEQWSQQLTKMLLKKPSARPKHFGEVLPMEGKKANCEYLNIESGVLFLLELYGMYQCLMSSSPMPLKSNKDRLTRFNVSWNWTKAS